MFNNIGKKIKMLAKILCWAGVGGSVITGIIFMCYDWGVLLGLGIALVGPLLAWVGSFFSYGFGELIDKTMSIDAKLGGQKNAPVNQQRAADLNALYIKGVISKEEYDAAMMK